MLLFPNPVSGVPRGGLGNVNFSLKSFSKLDFFGFKVLRNVEILCVAKSPRGPPDTGFGKSNISAFTGKKLMS